MEKSLWHKYLTNPGRLRLVAVEATEVCNQMCHLHGLSGPSRLGFAEALVGSFLVASGHKGDESINLNAQGSGLIRQVVVDVTPDGKARGFLRPGSGSVTPAAASSLWGNGMVSILYTQNLERKHPYSGMVPIQSESLDEAINEYFRVSEQSKSRVGFKIDFDGEKVNFARGILLHALGGAASEEIEAVEQMPTSTLRSWAAYADRENELMQALSHQWPNRQFKEIEKKPLQTFCNCSQERIERALMLTGEKDIKEALGRDPYLSVLCDFCRKEYRVSAERIRALFSTDPSRLQ
ncbi:MAG: Hsp33 family molecular chaperone HslO [Bdellovibrionales bacterium]